MPEFKRRTLTLVVAATLAGTAMSGVVWAQDRTRLSFLVDNASNTLAWAEQLKTDFEAQNPDIQVDIETRPGGAEGDNIIKTRLATQDMPDIFLYNSGSLFQAINPKQNLVPLTDQPFMANVIDSFKSVVSAGEDVYGVPIGAAMGGGVLYNIPIYEKLGLKVPKTWDEFMANSEKIKQDGSAAPVIQTFKDTWTSQLFVLGDFYNVLANNPDFPDKYTHNEAKFATTPEALAGFQHQADVFNAGYLNEDFQAAGYEDGVRMVATGEGAQYPMLTFAIGAIQQNYPENLDDVGFFALPGASADTNGLTVWEPAGIYMPVTTEGADRDAALKFLGFVASTDGCDSQSKAGGATGPYLIKGCTLPDDVPQAVKDLLPYFQQGGNNAPALEFLSPIKGPNLEQITVEVGSGFRSPEEGAKLYDDDVRKQALQLGIKGW